MEMISVMIFLAITLIVHYKMIGFCLMGLIVYHALKNDPQTLMRSVLAFCLSGAIVIGLPLAIIKTVYSETQAANAEIEIMKEVIGWLHW